MVYSRSYTMVYIKHTCDSVETEAIEAVFFHPETKVAQKEAQDLVVAVVEQPTVPQVMSALSSFMEIKVVCSIKHVQSIIDIF